ncbi:MAG TPA: M56 family metallopeptidase [Armatimonadota bacterium]|jgi:beta-lactamase regulating signal transducer with metallopeptidase domain
MDALLALPGTYHEWLALCLDATLAGSLLLVLAALLTAGGPGSAAQRHLLWTLALGGTLCLPLLALVVRGAQLSPIVWLNPLAETVGVSDTMHSVRVVSPGPPEALAPPTATSYPVHSATPRPTPLLPSPPKEPVFLALLPLIWGIGLVIVLAPLLVGLHGLHRITRTAQRIDDPEIAMLIADISALLHLRRPVSVLTTPGASTPFTWGWRRPALLFPVEALDWSHERLRLVLLHELAHIQRGDWLTGLLAQLVCALYWCNPLVWFAAYQLRRERELACDDVVLCAGFPASEYATHLLAIAQRAPRQRLLGAAVIPMARRTGLERRLCALLAATGNRRALTRWLVLGAAALGALVLLPLALLQCQVATPQTATTTLLVAWQAVVDKGMVERLRQHATSQRMTRQGYQVLRIANAPLLREVGNVHSPQRFGVDSLMTWREHSTTQNPFAGGGGSSITIGGESEMVGTSSAGRYTLEPKNRLLKVAIDYTELSCTLRRNNHATNVSSKGSPQFTGLLRPDESLVFVGDMGAYYDTHPQFLVVWQAVEVPNALVTAVKQINDADTWVTPNILHLVKRAEAWRHQAAGTASKKWQHTLSDGTTVTLFGLVDKAHYPLLQWDGDGNPIPPDTALFNSGVEYPEAYFSLTRPASARQQALSEDSPRVGFALGAMGSVDNDVLVGVGVGNTWTTRCVYQRLGDPVAAVDSRVLFTVTVGGYRVTLKNLVRIPAQGKTPARTRLQVECSNTTPDQEELIVAISTPDRKYRVISEDGIEFRQEKFASGMTRYERTIDVSLSAITRIELRTRPREWVTFAHLATAPAPAALRQAEATAAQW